MSPDEAHVGTRVTSYARTNPNDRGTIVAGPATGERVFRPDKFAFVHWDGDQPGDAYVYLLSELEPATPSGDAT